MDIWWFWNVKAEYLIGVILKNYNFQAFVHGKNSLIASIFQERNNFYLLVYAHDFLFCNFFSALLKQEKKSKLVLDENKTESAKILIFRFQIQTDRLDLIAVDLEDFCID